MPNFETLYNEYERTRNVCKFCEDYKDNHVATRFLLVRSLDKNNLKDIIRKYSSETDDGNIRSLIEKTYYSAITIEQLISYIENKRPELIKQRENELEGLSEILVDFPIVNCGIRNDKVDDIIKAFARNKSLKTMDQLMSEINNVILPRIRRYSMWSYYNQTANDIIELFFLKHPSVIPTLRKIHDIDFFIKVEKEIVPFDLKITHISDSYFDIASQGIVRNQDNTIYDDFLVTEDIQKNELKCIKSYYSAFKREHKEFDLPNLGGYGKSELLNLLIKTENEDALQFVETIKKQHINYIPTTADSLYSLEWWNYKYQGERLFCNNNRLYVFLAYINRIEDGRELKGKTAAIGKKINQLLDNINAESIHTVHYHYDKAASLTGDYKALSLSTIYCE